MLGHKSRVFKPYSEVCLDDLVPHDNFYSQAERCLDLDFVRDLVCDLYSDTGRPLLYEHPYPTSMTLIWCDALAGFQLDTDPIARFSIGDS